MCNSSLSATTLKNFFCQKIISGHLYAIKRFHDHAPILFQNSIKNLVFEISTNLLN